MVRRRIDFMALAYVLSAMTLLPGVQWCGTSWADISPEGYAPCAVACAGERCEPGASCDGPSDSVTEAARCADTACGPATCEPATSCTDSGCEGTAGASATDGNAWCPMGLFAGLSAAKNVDDDVTPALTSETGDLDPPIRATGSLPQNTVLGPRGHASRLPPIRGPPPI